MDLIKVIKTIESKLECLEKEKQDRVSQIEKEYDAQINDYKKALEVNKKLNTVCLDCKGRGKILHYRGFQYDEGEWIICKRCGGTGKEPHSNK